MLKSRSYLLLGSCLISLLVFECALRVILPPPQRVSIVRAEIAASKIKANSTVVTMQGMPNFGLYRHTESGKRLRPNCTAHIQNHHINGLDTIIKTNSLGFRGDEIRRVKDRKRVLFLGDSITFGDYLPEEQIFVSIIERLSQETATPYETVNAGIGAVGIQTELAILVENVATVNPDLVVLNFYLNDVQPSIGINVNDVPGFLRWSRTAHLMTSALAYLNLKSTDYGYVNSAVIQRWYQETENHMLSLPKETDTCGMRELVLKNFNDWGSAWSTGAFAHMKPIFAEFARQMTVNGFEFYIVVFPVSYQVEYSRLFDYPQQQIKALAEELDIPLLDLLSELREDYTKTGQNLFFDQCHPNIKGNELIASWILKFIQRSDSSD